MLKIVLFYMSLQGSYMQVDTGLVFKDMDSCRAGKLILQEDQRPLVINGQQLVDVRAICKGA